MIHLKRFKHEHRRIKLYGHVEFPLTLEVSFSAIPEVYNLRSLVVHYGTVDRGHYVNFSLRQGNVY
jgi:ubiquitin carboxyl-terminal hydrolase 2/21/ubiquitin carboxyl-terminal hydrolase 8/ubiquitin carboxyl-terminal hydrolase 36/42